MCEAEIELRDYRKMIESVLSDKYVDAWLAVIAAERKIIDEAAEAAFGVKITEKI